jgi:hypothetical protein
VAAHAKEHQQQQRHSNHLMPALLPSSTCKRISWMCACNPGACNGSACSSRWRTTARATPSRRCCPANELHRMMFVLLAHAGHCHADQHRTREHIIPLAKRTRKTTPHSPTAFHVCDQPHPCNQNGTSRFSRSSKYRRRTRGRRQLHRASAPQQTRASS